MIIDTIESNNTFPADCTVQIEAYEIKPSKNLVKKKEKRINLSYNINWIKTRTHMITNYPFIKYFTSSFATFNT